MTRLEKLILDIEPKLTENELRVLNKAKEYVGPIALMRTGATLMKEGSQEKIIANSTADLLEDVVYEMLIPLNLKPCTLNLPQS